MDKYVNMYIYIYVYHIHDIYIYTHLELLYADTCFGKICIPLKGFFVSYNEKSELQFHYVDSMLGVLKMLHLYDPWNGWNGKLETLEKTYGFVNFPTLVFA